MIKLSKEQIRANEEAINSWTSASERSSVRALANFLHYAEHYGLNVDQYIDEARAIYKAETTPVKKKVTREVAGMTANDYSAASFWVCLDKPIPSNTTVRVIYETEEEGE